MGPLSLGTRVTTQESASKLIYTNLSSQNIGYDIGSVVLNTKGYMKYVSRAEGMVTRLKTAPPPRWPNLLHLKLWRTHLIIQFSGSWMLNQRLRKTLVCG
ncbi:hypothetical protein LINPERHAP2_LOCUS12202 [Linum perenne]